MTGLAARRKGYEANRAVVNYLRANGFPHCVARSTGMAGADIDELGPGLEIEVKNRERWDLSGWLDQLTEAMEASDAEQGALIVKRKGTTDVASWYFVQTFDLWRQIVPAPAYEVRQRHRIDLGSLAADVDFAEAQSDQSGCLVGYVRAPRRRGPDYAITTVGHGVRLLRAAGWGSRLEENL